MIEFLRSTVVNAVILLLQKCCRCTPIQKQNDSWIKKEKIFSVKSLGFSENSLMHAQRFSYLRKANFYKNSNQHSIILQKMFLFMEKSNKNKILILWAATKSKKSNVQFFVCLTKCILAYKCHVAFLFLYFDIVQFLLN